MVLCRQPGRPPARIARGPHPGHACHTEEDSLFSPCVPVNFRASVFFVSVGETGVPSK